MAGRSDDDKDLVRLQIPVSQALADRVAELAEQADRSQGFFAGLLLELALDCCENLPRWLGRRAIGPAGKGWGIGWRQQRGDADVRLQVKLTRDSAERIQAFGDRLNHTTVRAAALLLDFAVDDNASWFEVMNSGPGKAIRSLVGIRKTRELAELDYQRDVPDFEDSPQLGEVPGEEPRTSL